MKTSLLKGWQNLWSFIAGAFTDDVGHTSAMRICMYLTLLETFRYINHTLSPSGDVLLYLTGIFAGCAGIKLAKDIKGTMDENKTSSTTTMTTELKQESKVPQTL